MSAVERPTDGPDSGRFRQGFGAYCGCGARTFCAPTDHPQFFIAVEYDPDGFTPSGIRHVCQPDGERVGWLIKARRAAAAETAQPGDQLALPIAEEAAA